MSKPAHECQTMTDVRLGVDEIDRQLVALIAKRQTYMAAAARIKTDRNTVHDSARIEDVVAKVVASAKEHGLSIDIAEPVWRELIRRSIAYEFKEWDKIRTAPMDETG